MNCLEIKILLEFDILIPKNIILNIQNQKIIIDSYDNLQMDIIITQQEINSIYQLLFANQYIVIPLYSITTILVKFNRKLPEDWNFLFEL